MPEAVSEIRFNFTGIAANFLMKLARIANLNSIFLTTDISKHN